MIDLFQESENPDRQIGDEAIPINARSAKQSETQNPDRQVVGFLSVIIVSFNTKDLTEGCISSLYSTLSGISFEIIVVDNGSVDGSAEMIKRDFPNVTLIEQNRNIGFAAANNRGIEKANGEYILLLNSDTKIVDDSIKKMLEFAKNNGEVVVAPRLIFPDGNNQESCQNFPTISGAIREFWFGKKGGYLLYSPNTKVPISVECAIAACLLVPKKIFDQVGGFDERYFMYYEDIDFCKRVKSNGFSLYFFPSAKVIHFGGASGKVGQEDMYKKLVESSRRYHGLITAFIIHKIIWLGQKFGRGNL